MGEFPRLAVDQRVECAGRADEEPLCTGPQPLGLELGLGRGGRGKPMCRRRGDGNRRSIISPSSVCGVVGMKPTVGLVSRGGIVPISSSQDTAGPIGRTVGDAAILLGAMTGIDARDPATERSGDHRHADYTKFLEADGLRGAGIGVPRRFFRPGTLADHVTDAALETLKGQGAILVDPADIPSLSKIGDAEYQVLLYEFKACLNAYLASLGRAAPVHTLAEIIEFNQRNAEKELPYFGQDTMTKAQKKGPLTEKAYLDAVEKCRRLSRDEGIDAVMNEHKLDAFVAADVAGRRGRPT